MQYFNVWRTSSNEGSQGQPFSTCTVASLGWVTPGAATEGVTPIFFCSSLSLSLSPFIAFTRVSPPPRCHPTPFLPVRPRFSTILCKFAHNFFPSGVTPLEGVTRGGPPPSDATACINPVPTCCTVRKQSVNVPRLPAAAV